MTIEGLQRAMTVEDLRRQILDLVPAARVSVEQFPSGTVVVDIDQGERSFLVELSARCQAVGVSELTHRIPMDWSGHDEAFETLDQAADYLFSLLNVPRDARTSRPAV